MNKPCAKVFKILVFLLCFKAFAYGGVLTGQKELRVKTTAWFDIIYPPECSVTADILYKNVDRIYTEICEAYGRLPSFRMPLVITSECEASNAYWSNYPYNRIVVYDTAPSEELEVNSENILSIVTHELTHAVSMNTTCKPMLTVQKIFGDGYSLSFWLTSRGMAEGATVSMESSKGEGRLNSEYITFMLKQAKLEGVFPEYYDVQCTEDVYPYNDYYFFNGAFNEWLCKKYGMEKYAELWFDCVNMQAMDFAGAFYNVYNVQIFDAWEEFKNQLKIPEGLATDPVQGGLSKDFFEPGNAEYSLQNDSGRLYTSLVYSRKGLAYVDSLTDSVFFVPSSDLQNDKIKPQKLFTLRNVRSIRFSDDGNYLIADYYSINKGNIKSAVKIYNMNTKSFYSACDEGSEQGLIIENNGKLYFVWKDFCAQFNSIRIAQVHTKKDGNIDKIDFNEGNIKTIYFPFEVNPSGFTALSDGRFVFMLKDKMDFSVCVMNINGEIEKSFYPPSKDYVIRYLSTDLENPSVLNFTWTRDDSFPRYGRLNTETGKCELQKKDMSGGVYYPVRADGKIIYIGEFFNQPRILCLKDEGSFESTVLKTGKIRTIDKDTYTKRNDQDTDYEAYFPLKYYTRGLLIPFSSITSYSYANDSSLAATLPFGLSYSSTNPWGDREFTATIGYGLETNSLGLDLHITGGTDTNLFKYSAGAFVEFDGSGFKQTYGTLELASLFPVGNHSFFSVGAGSKVWYGRSNYENHSGSYFAHLDASLSETSFYAFETLSLSFKDIVLKGPGRNSYSGFNLSLLLSKMDNFGVSGPSWKKSSFELGLLSTIYIPNLIPVDCKRGIIWNLPLKLDLNLFTNSQKISSNIVSDLLSGVSCFYEPVFSLAGIKAELMLFGCEIQSAIPLKSLLWIYLHDFHVSFIYSGGFDFPATLENRFFSFTKTPQYMEEIKNGNILYEQYFGIRLYTGLSFNFGMSTKTSICFDIYPLNTKDQVFMALSFGCNF